MTDSSRRKTSGFLVNIYAMISSIGCLYPIFWLLQSSLKSQAEFDANSFALPRSVTFHNYVQVFRTTNMFRYICNSAFVAIGAVLGVIIISYIVGYFLSRFTFKGRKIIMNLFLLGLLIPIHSLMIPMYIQFSRIGLTDSLVGLMLPYICFQLPVSIYLVESYVRSIPREMEAAASIDGASFSRTLFSVIFPIAKPIVVTVGIIAFFYFWNEFSFALILINKASLRTVPLGLALFSGSFTTNYPVMMSAMVIASVPTLLLYILFSKQIMDGMVAGAVKG